MDAAGYRMAEALYAALDRLRLALENVLSAEDTARLRRWIGVVAATPSVVKAVLGGVQLKTQLSIAEFLASRLGLPSDALVPTMLAAAVQGVIQTVQTQWFFRGGDLAKTISDGLEVLERGIGSDPRTWSDSREKPKSPRRKQRVHPRSARR
jgi:hypothetical protein